MWCCGSNDNIPQKEDPPWTTKKSIALCNSNEAMSSEPEPEPERVHVPEPLHEAERDWSEIHEDILQLIAQHLKLYSDYIRLRAVCRTWRSHFPLDNLPTQLPWLLYSLTRIITPTPSSRRAFYDVSTQKFHSIHLPEASYPHRIAGSSHGFLVVKDYESPQIFCYNPLTKYKVFMAPLSTLPGVVSFSKAEWEYDVRHDPYAPNDYSLDMSEACEDFLTKIILSTSPTKDVCIAVAIISWACTGDPNDLAYCKPGDNKWWLLPCTDFNAQDVIYCQSKKLFYAVNTIGDVVSFTPKNAMEIIKNVDTIIEGKLKYLVKSSTGELLLVARYMEVPSHLRLRGGEYYVTTGFRVLTI